MPSLRILAYSARPESLASAISTLASRGYEVAGTTNEGEALTKFRSGAIDVLLMNLPPVSPDGTPWSLTIIKTGPRTAVVVTSQGPEPSLPMDASLDNLPAVLREVRAGLDTAQRQRGNSLLAVSGLAVTSTETEDLLPKFLEALAKAANTRAWIFLGPAGQEEVVSADKAVLPPSVREMARWARDKGTLTLGGQNTPQGWVPPRGSEGEQAGYAMPLRLGASVYGAAVFLPNGRGQLPADAIEAAVLFQPLLAALAERRQMRRQTEESKQQLTQMQDVVERRQQEVRALNNLLQMEQNKNADLSAQEKLDLQRGRSLEMLRVMANATETGDPTASGNSGKAAVWASTLGKALGLTAELVMTAAYLHNLGTVRGIDPASPQRKQLEQKHPVIAEQMAKALGLPLEVQLAVRHHHENYDGSGYPDGLKGEVIPMAARILRAVDDLIAITQVSTPAPSANEVLMRLKNDAGRMYDPAVLDAMERAVATQTGRAGAPEMISTVTHELRSPLSALVGYSEMLATQGDLPKEAQDRANDIHQEALHMSGLVEELLQVSRYEAGRMDLHPKDTNLTMAVARAVNKARLRGTEHEIEAELAPGLTPIKTDPDKLAQVLDNLLDNAVKYSPSGGRVVVRVESRDRQVVVSISDQGIGLSEEQRRHLFEKFYRADSAIKDQVAGTGLGLYLCKHIVEAQGGKMWVDSQEGKGSTFAFSLPL